MSTKTKSTGVLDYLDLFGYAKPSRRRRPGGRRFAAMRKQRSGKAVRIPAWVPIGLGAAAAVTGYTITRKKSMANYFRGKSVVIAGGSRGLGLVIGRMLAEEGAHITLLARSPDDLESAEAELRSLGAEVMTWPVDLRDQEQVEMAITRAVRQFGNVDVLFNIEGVMQVGPLETMDVDDFREAMDTHFWGPLYTILAVRHYMKQGGGGRIVNITSIGGKVAVPHLAPYVASKFALVGLSDAVRAELAKDNIKVTTVVPGLMRTGSHVNANFKGDNEKEYAWFSIMDSLPITSTSAESAAHKIIEACRYGRPQLTITPQARLIEVANTVTPGLVAWGMKMTNNLLPKTKAYPSKEAHTGWESQSEISPSPLTKLADEQVEVNREGDRTPGEER